MKIIGLSKKYAEHCVLNDINLDVTDGSVFCLLGGSGEGKTTLLNCIAGLMDYEGTISAHTSSYVFQNDRLIPEISLYDNLRYVLGNFGKEKTGEQENKIDELLQIAGIFEKKFSKITELSGGMAQRASFIRAELFDSDVMLMDEPFRSLDLKTKKNIADLFLKLHNTDGRTVFFVTHDVYEALYVSDRIAVISDGKIIYDKCVPENERGMFYGAEGKMRDELISLMTQEE